MPLRVSNTVEKNVTCMPTLPLSIVGNAAAVVALPSIHNDAREYAGRYIQNSDPTNNVYYSYGNQCSNVSYNGIIAPLQQLDASNCGDSVYVYATANVKISTTLLVRKDLTNDGGGIL